MKTKYQLWLPRKHDDCFRVCLEAAIEKIERIRRYWNEHFGDCGASESDTFPNRLEKLKRVLELQKMTRPGKAVSSCQLSVAGPQFSDYSVFPSSIRYFEVISPVPALNCRDDGEHLRIQLILDPYI